MIPSAWQFAILTLAVFRIYRLLAEDTVPPLPEWRDRLVGFDHADSTFKRPVLADMIACGYCAGFWLSLITASLWYWQPHATLVVAVFPALSGAVGLVHARLAS